MLKRRGGRHRPPPAAMAKRSQWLHHGAAGETEVIARCELHTAGVAGELAIKLAEVVHVLMHIATRGLFCGETFGGYGGGSAPSVPSSPSSTSTSADLAPHPTCIRYTTEASSSFLSLRPTYSAVLGMAHKCIQMRVAKKASLRSKKCSVCCSLFCS